MADALVSQAVVEYALFSATQTRVSQAIIEVLYGNTTTVNLSQSIIEYIPGGTSIPVESACVPDWPADPVTGDACVPTWRV